jgi:hypothetical protein
MTERIAELEEQWFDPVDEADQEAERVAEIARLRRELNRLEGAGEKKPKPEQRSVLDEITSLREQMEGMSRDQRVEARFRLKKMRAERIADLETQMDKFDPIDDADQVKEARTELIGLKRDRLEELKQEMDRFDPIDEANQIEEGKAEMERLLDDLKQLEEKEKTTIVPFELKSVEGFGSAVRASTRGLWSGAFDSADFTDSMISAIIRYLNEAWAEGTKECGIKEDELTSQEISARDQLITSQFPHVRGFADDIVAGSKANGGKLGPQLQRGSVWVHRYEEAKNQAKSMACGNRKLKWTLGEAEHCTTCLKLSGKVKRGSQWNDAGIYPQMRSLECRGYRCQCSLVPTDDPMSKGPFPSIP